MSFAHLHVRSWFSFLAGGSPPEALALRAAQLGIPALALTDRHGVYGAVRLQKACRIAGIRPIIGAEVCVEGAPLVLLARSPHGYAQLCQLLTEAHLADRLSPRATLQELATHHEDLFCLSGGRDSRLDQLIEAGHRTAAEQWLSQLREIFGPRLFVELTHHRRPGDHAHVAALHELAQQLRLPVVASGDVRHAVRRDYRRYDLLTCIRLGCTLFESRPERPVNAEAFLTSEAALRRLIPFPEAFENAAAIAAQCELDLLPGYIIPPAALLPDGKPAGEHLAELCRSAIPRRYPNGSQRRAEAQLQKELDVILGLGLEEYFLTVHQVVLEARRRGIRCAGRGSAANSIVAYLLEITGVDPLEHNLLFERFLHSGRKGIPDIDIDFDSDRREEIIAWMEETFGQKETAMTATVVTYQLRLALRDTAKALGWPMETVDELSRAVPSGRACRVEEYRERLAKVLGPSPMFEVLMKMTAELDECPRHLGQHSGGMLLSRRPLYHFTPLQVSANGVTIAQFDKHDVEALGLTKLDVLGLRMLAALSEAVELVQRHEGPVDIDSLTLDDPQVYQMIQESRTLAVFQIESQGQLHLLAQHQPECFADLISEVALFRPGPLQGGMVNPFIRRRRGLEPVVYDHPDLEPVLRDTYGIILFQEQILEVAYHFAGMSLSEADDFRSLMSKFRDPGQMEAMREKFVSGATGRGVPARVANLVFDKVANFVGYGFCKSHAAAFARTVYQSSWMKFYHPAAYMAAVMQHRPGMYNPMTLEEEARRFGVATLLPEINRSGIRYDLERDAEGRLAIRKPLASVKEVSSEAAGRIVWARLRGGFTSVEDLYRRVELSREALEGLAISGALDALAGDSRRALWEIGVLARKLGPAGQDCHPTLIELPALLPEEIPALPALLPQERLSWDYRSHDAARVHPMTLVRRTLNQLRVPTVEACFHMLRSPKLSQSELHPVVTTAGIVVLRQKPPTAKGVMFITLEDETGMLQCVVKPPVQERYGDLLTQPALIVRGPLHGVGNWRGIVVEEALPLAGMLGGYMGHAASHGGADYLVREAPAHDDRQRKAG